MTAHGDAAAVCDAPRAVAIVTPGWPQERFSNGITKYVAKMRPALEARGTRVGVLALKTDGAVTGPGVLDLEAYAPWREPPPLLWRLLRRVEPDAVSAYRTTRAILGALRGIEDVALLQMEESFGLPRIVQRHARVPVVVRLHGPWFLNGPAAGAPEDAAFRRRVQQEGRAIAAADGVTAPSQDVIDQTRRHYGLALEHAEAIPNPRDDVAAGDQWRLETCDRALVLFVGRFDRHKGGDVIVDAFARLARMRPDVRLCFVGPDRGVAGADGRTLPLADYIAAHVADTAAAGRIAYVGEQPHSALAALRRKAYVTVVCSRYENFANTATEALALGCPLIATRTGGLPEIVQDRRNGLLCAPDDAAALAAAIGELLDAPDLAERLGQQAAADSRARYDPAVLAERTLAYYAGVLRRWKR